MHTVLAIDLSGASLLMCVRVESHTVTNLRCYEVQFHRQVLHKTSAMCTPMHASTLTLCLPPLPPITHTPTAPVEAGPGASFFLVELLLGHVTNTTVRASSDCVLWVVRGTAVLRLAASRPDFVLELGLKMSQEMAAQVGQLEADIQVRGSGSATGPRAAEACGAAWKGVKAGSVWWCVECVGRRLAHCCCCHWRDGLD